MTDDKFTDDIFAPTLTEVTPVTTRTNDTTPNYTFSSNEAGTIAYGGSCSSDNTSATVDNNTITFRKPSGGGLDEGTYSNCNIRVTDDAGNTSPASTALVMVVDTTKPQITLVGSATETVEANAFDYLRSCDEQFDLIILDPPSFTRSKKALGDAMRGYKEIHLRALKLLDHDGYLATFSCSHHVSRELFLNNVRDAAVDAHRTLRLVESFTQRADHPILPTIPETEYLKGFCFQLLPGR